MKLLDLAAAGWARLPMVARRHILGALNHRVMIGAVGLIPDEAGRILLLEHRFRVPFRWGLPGGFLEPGERPEEGLRRELAEETGLVVSVDPEIFDTEYNLAGGYVSLSLVARVEGGQLGSSREILDARYFDPRRLPEGTYPHHVRVIERWLHTRRSSE